jgi:glycosyltransferase involved in cell wall biosynthesis
VGWLLALSIPLAGVAVWMHRLGALYRGRASAPGPVDAVPRVSIIVPARNEAHNLPALLDSLAALSPPPAEVIVVDDHSDDGTGELAAARGARVVMPPPLPAGWMGKPWACKAGAAAATGELLLFTDADTSHAPDSLARAVARLEQDRLDLLSVVPTHVVRAAWERAQGVFQLLLLVACRAGAEPVPGSGERRFSIGQYLLWRRATYERVGGHDAVKNRVAEDLAFARMVSDHGGRFGLLFSPGVMRVRMYPEGFAAFVRGWRRNFREGIASAGAIGTLEVALVIGWLLGVPLSLALAVAGGESLTAGVWLAVYAGTALEVGRRQRALGRFGATGAAFYPGFVLVFVWVSVLAMLDKLRGVPVQWRGRSVPS